MSLSQTHLTSIICITSCQPVISNAARNGTKPERGLELCSLQVYRLPSCTMPCSMQFFLGKIHAQEKASSQLAAVSADEACWWLILHYKRVGSQVLPHSCLLLCQVGVIQKAVMCCCTMLLCSQHTVAQIHPAGQNIVSAHRRCHRQDRSFVTQQATWHKRNQRNGAPSFGVPKYCERVTLPSTKLLACAQLCIT